MRMRPGSTLIELLVVIAIVAILAATLFRSYGLAENGDPSAELDALAAKLARADPAGTGPIERTRPATMVTVDCQRLTHTQKVAMMFLQGLANRRGPRLFLGGLEPFNVGADRWWSIWSESTGLRDAPLTGRVLWSGSGRSLVGWSSGMRSYR